MKQVAREKVLVFSLAAYFINPTPIWQLRHFL
jgi:hypothetical protein